jgi:CheY-like chemotaxis protein
MNDTSAAEILIVEDEENLRLIMREHLQDAGHPIVEATSGAEARQLLQSQPLGFATVILDRRMPGEDGLELLREMKRDDRLRYIPVILQTGLGERDEILQGIEAGAFYYLVKPYDRQLLLEIVKTAVADHRRHEQVMERVHLGQSTLGMLTFAEYRFRSPAQARALAACLCQAFPEPGRAATGLLELFMNAVEHGNLGLGYKLKGALQNEDRWTQEIDRRLRDPVLGKRQVTVSIVRMDKRLRLQISDEGDGFDWTEYLNFSVERARDTHGRGIAMTRALSFDNLEYLGKGNQVRVTVDLSDEPVMPS